jgi:hypothetical protein
MNAWQKKSRQNKVEGMADCAKRHAFLFKISAFLEKYALILYDNIDLKGISLRAFLLHFLYIFITLLLPKRMLFCVYYSRQ